MDVTEIYSINMMNLFYVLNVVYRILWRNIFFSLFSCKLTEYCTHGKGKTGSLNVNQPYISSSAICEIFHVHTFAKYIWKNSPRQYCGWVSQYFFFWCSPEVRAFRSLTGKLFNVGRKDIQGHEDKKLNH